MCRLVTVSSNPAASVIVGDRERSCVAHSAPQESRHTDHARNYGRAVDHAIHVGSYTLPHLGLSPSNAEGTWMLVAS